MAQQQNQKEKAKAKNNHKHTSMAEIAMLVKHRRQQADMSLHELSRQSGVSFPTISRLERNLLESVQMQTLWRIFEAMDCALVITSKKG